MNSCIAARLRRPRRVRAAFSRRLCVRYTRLCACDLRVYCFLLRSRLGCFRPVGEFSPVYSKKLIYFYPAFRWGPQASAA